ncbi:Flp pilus assembly protein CpaB [Sphaerisporangium sp. TRM90804]|uniref:Flp pilus assembly protein CpaB n=1 Tax=Sphaerisporangium sp. TRM90804 TaxID=3031113 RepID=UPI002447A363|nr:Flp pilus assembly protein CpaB [Sphaerisporangium sp. TRM90804]MDH2430473.1 Flp pilus assembly protein CpaB [Sphaerisporangium sp. TRM90804]
MRTSTIHPIQALNRRRRLIAAILAAAAVGCLGLALQPPDRLTEVLAAARDLTGGRLNGNDVTVVRLPPEAVPDGVYRPGAQLTGRVLAAPVRRGEPITDLRLLGPALVDAYGPGMRATPIRVTDAASAGLLRPGDVIDVIANAATPQWEDIPSPGPATIAQAVTVIALPRPAGAADTNTGALVVLATTPDQATQLARAGPGSHLSITIHGRSG